uniref:Uncharacterized protein n=1 Tax=Octopus bimaculoides TaxID=37653 RepID=A0A0L8GJH2_OCTBM
MLKLWSNSYNKLVNFYNMLKIFFTFSSHLNHLFYQYKTLLKLINSFHQPSVIQDPSHAQGILTDPCCNTKMFMIRH